MQTQCLFPFPVSAGSTAADLATAAAQPQIKLFVLGYFHTLPKFADNTREKEKKESKTGDFQQFITQLSLSRFLWDKEQRFLCRQHFIPA